MKRTLKTLIVSTSIFILALSFFAFQVPLTSAQSSSINVKLGPNLQLSNPNPNIGLYHCSKTSSCPMGISDYGVNKNTKYTYYASVFESWANFTKLSISGEGAISIQQNIVTANTSSGKTVGEYWPQDVPFVSQSGSTYTINEIDNIWNFSYTGICDGQGNDGCMANMAGNLLGRCSQYGGAPEYYYCESSQQFTVKLPFEIFMNTTVFILQSGTYKGHTAVEFGIWVYHDNTFVKGEWYDLVAFSGTAKTIPVVKVGGMNPLGLYNDAETVLCGPGGGSSATITAINATLWEGYIARGSSTLKAIPHAWSAGTDTAETVYGVHMTAPTEGIGTALHGSDNNNQLW